MDFYIKNKITGEYWSEKYGWLRPDKESSYRKKHNDASKQLVTALPRFGEWEEVRVPRYFHYFRQSNECKFIRYHRGRGVACNLIIEAETSDEAIRKARSIEVPIGNSFDGVVSIRSDSIDYGRWSYVARGLTPAISRLPVTEESFKEVPEKPNQRNQGYIHYMDGRVKFFSI